MAIRASTPDRLDLTSSRSRNRQWRRRKAGVNFSRESVGQVIDRRSVEEVALIPIGGVIWAVEPGTDCQLFDLTTEQHLTHRTGGSQVKNQSRPASPLPPKAGSSH